MWISFDIAAHALGAVEIVHTLNEVGADIAATAVVVVLVWCRDALRYHVLRIWRTLLCIVRRSSYVLIWNDVNIAHSHKLISHLRKDIDRHTIFSALHQPNALRAYPLASRWTRAIVLLDADVTKLASNPKHAEKIEQRLTKYVERGGGLVAGHDVLWRRVRSKALQEIAGGELKRFEFFGDRPVPYQVNPEHKEHPLRNGLPDTFPLTDGEVCWGKWVNDASVVYTTDDDKDAFPLVVAHEFAVGRSVWLNSGDMGDSGLCLSIAKPEENFVKLLVNAIGWVSDAG